MPKKCLSFEEIIHKLREPRCLSAATASQEMAWVIGAAWHSRIKLDYDEYLCVLRRLPARWLAIDDDPESWPEAEMGNRYRLKCTHVDERSRAAITAQSIHKVFEQAY